MQRIGVFGSSFNPPTLGHLDVLKQALPHFEQILLIPAWSHPFGKKLISVKHRLAMLELFIKDPLFAKERGKLFISTIEQTLFELQHQQGPIYTFDVLTKLEAQFATNHQKVQLHFILGPDISAPNVWEKFYRYQDIQTQWPLFIAKENIPIHSTQVREICAQVMQSELRKAKLVELVGENIADYIEQHKLYQSENVYG